MLPQEIIECPDRDARFFHEQVFLKRGAKPTAPTEAKRHAPSPSKTSAVKPHAEEETSVRK